MFVVLQISLGMIDLKIKLQIMLYLPNKKVTWFKNGGVSKSGHTGPGNDF